MSKTWKIVFLVLVGIGVVLLGYHLRAIFVPLLVALLLAYILNPIVTGLEKRGVPRLASIAAIYAMLLGILAVVVLWIVPMGFREAKEFIQVTFIGENAKIKRVIDWSAEHLQEWLHVKSKEEVLAAIQEKLKGHEGQLASGAGRVATAILGFGTGSLGFFLTLFSFIALVPVYLFFLLKNMNLWWTRFTHWLPRAYRERTLATLARIHRAVASFFRGQITISLLEGLIIFLGLKLIGIKFSFLFGLMYAVLSIFPYIGVALGFTIVELFVFADAGFGSKVLIVAGLFAAIQILESVVLQPMILGKETGLHPIVIILGLLICGELFGFFGMLIAVPITSAVKIVLDDYVWPAYEEVADLTKVRQKPPPATVPPSGPANPVTP